MNTKYKALTAAELYAFEQAARRERAKAQAELMSSFGRWLKRAFTSLAFRPYAAPRAGKVIRHA